MAARRGLLVLLAICALRAAHGAEYLVTQQVFLDVSIGDEPPGRITLGLFGDVAPKTVRNFVALATGGVDGRSYKGAIFHRVIRKFMIQGGDVMRQDGTGSTSLYGESFDDETFRVKHTGPGMISMANAGKNTNGCQFFITTVPTPWLDNIHVAFGRVVDGMAVVHKIENTPTDADDRPLQPVVVVDAGALPTPKPFTVTDEAYE
ncbi:hypothetical protein R5R35_008648 [Gryllus longicercus]|uniref:Peptidyl-prolyl cis-trans isomerase n=1 Tax=Gryllus longicercus TaxID=2509291 RepID=A0AAN9VJK8_9ORTH